MRIEAAALTDVGKVRTNNEDYIKFLFVDKDKKLINKGNIFIVSDGMGGSEAGEIASRTAVDHAIEVYYSLDSTKTVAKNLEYAILSANRKVYDIATENPEFKGMGCTLTAVVVAGRYAVFANIGDSRAYLIRDDMITQITQDHSWVAEQVRNGIINPENAENHPYKNVITRSLGVNEIVEVDMFYKKLVKNDIIILCSDGLHTLVEDETIREITTTSNAKLACRRLIDIANKKGGRDNISVVVLKMGKLSSVSYPDDTVRIPPAPEINNKNGSVLQVFNKAIQKRWGR